MTRFIREFSGLIVVIVWCIGFIGNDPVTQEMHDAGDNKVTVIYLKDGTRCAVTTRGGITCEWTK
jgi:hypothetical protein